MNEDEQSSSGKSRALRDVYIIPRDIVMSYIECSRLIGIIESHTIEWNDWDIKNINSFLPQARREFLLFFHKTYAFLKQRKSDSHFPYHKVEEVKKIIQTPLKDIDLNDFCRLFHDYTTILIEAGVLKLIEFDGLSTDDL